MKFENSILPSALNPTAANTIMIPIVAATIMVIRKLKGGLSFLVGSTIALIENAIGASNNTPSVMIKGDQLLSEMEVNASMPK